MPTPYAVRCPSCGKLGFRSSGSAKAGNKHAKFRLRTYQCSSGLWHVANAEKA